MKKFVSLGVLFVFFTVLVSTPSFSQTADEVVKKMIEAQGGKKVLESIKDITWTGTLEVVAQGIEGALTIYKKEPDKRRTDIDIALVGFVISQAYDGKTAWTTNQQTGDIEEMTEELAANARRQAMPVTAFLNLKKHGLSFALKEKEKIEEKEYIVLEQTYSDGFKTVLYVNPETYLTYKSVSTLPTQFGGEVEVENISTDYKKVNGWMTPHTVTSFQDGAEYMIVTITEVKINTGLEDSLFEIGK
jgi:outer membrane lipoprotein-sorting protein